MASLSNAVTAKSGSLFETVGKMGSYLPFFGAQEAVKPILTGSWDEYLQQM